MHKRAIGALAGAATLFAAFAAQAQSSSKDALKTCDSPDIKAAAFTYLTGKPSKSAWDQLVTGGNKKLEIDKGGLTATLVKDSSDYTVSAFVSVPFTAIRAYARLLYSPVKNHKKTDITVCHYALKETAKSWGSFEVGDLKPVFGRTLGGITAPTSVRLGGSAPPSGYRSSTVAVILVVNFGDTPTVKLELKSERK